MYLDWYEKDRQYSSSELRDFAAKIKEEIKKTENLRDWLQKFYRDHDYIMVTIRDYLQRAVNTQYDINKKF